ncbi:hemerythrin HHE cation binding domain-containing protein [Pseudoduganella flava]|uniref:Hemerythrin HHE cation binding domain-containing protein n=1 Tax=Pseudoduganella flava TaxID=871742 RepID=A0A562PC72_9BURK|nr:hemerythrin domain-containing protein [Pseudoduganella flava]QGZ38007.1 hemerythrin domain-containing protein [Pseudoduganella flava]TWI41830.1 hemerythrin HHE cation binding domain-containing protein [Pseudoduganella flava]
MSTLHAYLAGDHRACDEEYGWAESRVVCGDWPNAKQAFGGFVRHLEHHLEQEERILFPAIERATGSTMGPTAVMRSEHDHMRAIVRTMMEAIDARDATEFFEYADSLRMLMHQHNLKEESILYPMAERLLGDGAGAVLAAIHNENAAQEAA